MLYPDLTKLSSTFPRKPPCTIQRTNMIATLEDLFGSGSDVVIVRGSNGKGKTELLRQFSLAHAESVFSAFVGPASRWSCDSHLVASNLCDQIDAALGNKAPKTVEGEDHLHALRLRLIHLQRLAGRLRKTFWFVIDGLEEMGAELLHERSMILQLIPFGIACFRFLLTDSGDSLKMELSSRGEISEFPLPGFTFDETREFLSDLVPDRETMQRVSKASRTIPGHLASIRRMLLAGQPVDALLQELPEKLPDLFRMEWNSSSIQDSDLFMAVLAFDRRHHTVGSLSRASTSTDAHIKTLIEDCSFIAIDESTGQIAFISEDFARYARDRLETLRERALGAIIADLLDSTSEAETLNYLPGYLREAKRFDELLDYLSPQHISQLIDCTQSWIPLHQTSELGVETALEMERDSDLLRFGLQRSTISSMEFSEPWRSEIEARVSLGDYSAALSLVQQVVTQEDRLHLLAVIAAAQKRNLSSVDVVISEQIEQLAAQIDRRSLGEKGIDIATALVPTHPKLAIELVQESSKQANEDRGIEFALSSLSVRAGAESPRQARSSEGQGANLHRILQDPRAVRFLRAMAQSVEEFSPDEIIAEVSKWESKADQIYALRAWISKNSEHDDSGKVILYGLNAVLKAPTFASSAQTYLDLTVPLPLIKDDQIVTKIVSRIDGLRSTIESTGPTEAFVALRSRVISAMWRREPEACEERLFELFCYVEALPDHSTRLACFATLLALVGSLGQGDEPYREYGIHRGIVDGLESSIDEVLTRSADHFKAVRQAVTVLAGSDVEKAREVIGRLNTLTRRDSARVELIRAVGEPSLNCEKMDIISQTYNELTLVEAKTRAVKLVLDSLGEASEAEEILNQYVNTLVDWICSVPRAETRAIALSELLAIASSQLRSSSGGLAADIVCSIEASWEAIDVGWSRIDIGFEIAAKLANSAPEVAKTFVDKVEVARRSMHLDSEDPAISYVGCVLLTLRVFGGLLAKKLTSKGDFSTIYHLIDRIPSAVVRVSALTELALKLDLSGDLVGCREVVFQHIRPILEGDVIADEGARRSALVLAAPALYRAHPDTAMRRLEDLPQEYRDSAYVDISDYLIHKRLPREAADKNGLPVGDLTYEDFMDSCKLISLILHDALAYRVFGALLDDAGKDRHRRFTKPQQADMLKEASELARSHFPRPSFIQHEGYRILAEAKCVKLQRRGAWDNLIKRANAIPNVADECFVIVGITAEMPAKEREKARELLHHAKSLAETISSLDDKKGRLELVAEAAYRIDPKLSKACLRDAWDTIAPKDPDEYISARKSLIDFAYRLDPEFASSLAAETDDDPAREYAREKTRQHLSNLETRQNIANNRVEALQDSTNALQLSKLAMMMLSSLNSRTCAPLRFEDTRHAIRTASRLPFQDAYPILCWVLENAVLKYQHTDQAIEYIRPLFDAARVSAELAYSLAARVSIASTVAERHAIQTFDGPSTLVHPGSPERAHKMIDGLIGRAEKYLYITDPYFSLADLHWISRIRRVNSSVPVFVLTGRKHQLDSRIRHPWEEAFHEKWTELEPILDAGDTSIVIVGMGRTGQHPIHERWWLTSEAGLRLGTSLNGLGASRLSEVSEIPDSELQERTYEVERFLRDTIRTYNGSRISYLMFDLQLVDHSSETGLVL